MKSLIFDNPSPRYDDLSTRELLEKSLEQLKIIQS